MSAFEPSVTECGVVRSACRGVHTLDARVGADAQWALSVEPFDEEDYGLSVSDLVPDLSVDPNDGVLSVLNPSRGARAYHISVRGVAAAGTEKPLEPALEGGRPVLTFALRLPPRVVVDVCALQLGPNGVEDLDIASDVVDIVPPESPPLAPPSESYAFPLRGTAFLCTQAAGGGVVEAVECECEASSIHVSALFAWNRIALRLDDGAVVEYVHVAARSATVAVGDRVQAGDQLCLSGDVGFCPEPHLHVEMHLSTDRAAPSVPFQLRRRNGNPAVPKAGEVWHPPPENDDTPTTGASSAS